MHRSAALRHSGSAGVLMLVAALTLVRPGAGAPSQSPASTPRATAAPAGNAENGKKIYKTYGCYQCHGYAGQGGAGSRLAPNPISFPAFTRYTRQPRGSMPPYTTKVVSDQELADIYAFLKTIPKPPAVKDIPLLNSD